MSVSISWDSLKLRLALTAALLMGLSVAVTVVHAVREAERRARQTIEESNLGTAQIAADLSARVVEDQRVLAAAAREWPKGASMGSAQADAFLGRQTTLHAMFDRVLLLPPSQRAGSTRDVPSVFVPDRTLANQAASDVYITVPIPGDAASAPLLAGSLSLASSNFLTGAGRGESIGDAQIQTIVADQDGRILAAPDRSKVATAIDDEPRLRQLVARWRTQGAPLEPTPSTQQVDANFVAMAAVPGTSWMVFRVAPAEALLGRASRSIFRIVCTGVVSGLIGALAIFGVTAWLLRPMGQLKRRALRALDPDQPPSLDWPGGCSEVGQLSQVLRHVSEQLAASRREMAHSLRQMHAVLEHAPTGIAFTIDGRFAMVSRELERMLGYGRGDLDGSSWERLLPQSSDLLRESARMAIRDGFGVEPEVQLRRRDGSLVWVWLQGAVVQDRDQTRHKIWMAVDATGARRQREKLQWSATHDPLTDLANRREFEHQLRKLIADRRGQARSSALFIDLDHFKQVNDNAGHATGDALLRRVAQELQGRVRGEDVVARLGGDEFAVLLRGCALDQAVQVAEQIRLDVRAAGNEECALRAVTASIGVVEIDGTQDTLAAVMEAADAACYAAKHAGRDAVRVAASARPLASDAREAA
jgi:diguanylate cyclase (GGDEF)-like protein/PAS domain S-box-containing protein